MARPGGRRAIRAVNTFALPAEAVERLDSASPRVEIDHRPVADPEEVPVLDDARAEIVFCSFAPAGHVPGLRWLQVDSVGVDHLPAEELARRGVLVTNASGVYAAPIAEYVAGALFYAAQRVGERQASQRARAWPAAGLHGRLLRGKTVVIVGYGGIGRAVAHLVAGLGMRVIAIKARPGVLADSGFHEPGVGDPDGTIPERIVGIDELVASARLADYLVLALPGTAATRLLVDAAVIAALPEHAWVVNVGRGASLDEAALARALADGRIAGAVLDVFQQEPLPPDSALWALDNVLITPHSSGYQRVDVLVELLAENIRRYVAGEQLVNVVDLARGY